MHFALFTLIYSVFVAISLLLPGYVIVKRTAYFADRPGIELSLGYATSLVLYMIFAVITYVSGVSSLITSGVVWLILLSAGVDFVYSKYYKNIWELRFPILCLLAMSIASLAFLGLTFGSPYTIIPDPSPNPTAHYNVLNVKALNLADTPANDNYIPYRQAQFFVNRSNPATDSFISEWGVTFFERTPLMGAVTASYFNLLHEKPPIPLLWEQAASDPHHTYVQFQILASFLNNLFVIPAFFVIRKMFTKKTALISCLFLIISQFFLYNTFFSWPKSLVAFFILVTWLILLQEKRRGDVIVAGLVCAAAYATHDLAILYLGATALFLLWNRRFRALIWVCVWPFLTALAWIIIASKIYSQPSSFIYYPLATTGLPPVDGKGVIHQFIHTNPFRIIQIRLINLLYLLSPYQLFTSEGNQSAGLRLWALGICSIPGALGMGLFPAVFVAFWRRLANWNFLILAIVPVMGESLLIGWPKGLGALHFAEATVVLWTGLAVYALLKLQNRLWLMVAFAINAALYIFMITYCYNFAIGTWFGNLHDIIIMLFFVALISSTGWAIYRISHDKPVQLLYN